MLPGMAINDLNGQQPMVLYGENGRPIELTNRHADNSALGHVLTFASIIRGASNTYFHLWDEAMRQSRENALAMRRDTFLMALLEERKDATSSLKWHLEPDNPRDPRQAAVAAALEKMLQATPDLISLQHYLLEALWYGRYAAFMNWTWAEMDLPQANVASSAVPGSGGSSSAMQRCLVVESHYPINGDKIGHFHDHVPYVKIHSGEHDKIKGVAEVVPTTEGFGLALGGEWRERVLLHYHMRDDADFFEAEMAERVHGVGIRSVISFYEYLRKDFIAAVIDALERFGLGIVVIRYDASNARAKAEAEDLAKNMSRRSVVTVPVTKNGSESAGGIEIIEGPTAGIQYLLSLREYCDEKIERFIVGQALSDGVGGAGKSSGGLAQFAAKTQHRRFSGDAHRLAETMAGSKMRPGLVSIMKQHSFPDADFPVKWSYSIEDPEAERKLGAVSMGVNIGLKFIKNEVLGLTGMSEPSPEDDVISMESLQQMMGQQQPGMGGQALPPGEGGEGGGEADIAALLGDMQSGGGSGGEGQSMQMRRDGGDGERLRWLRGEALARGDRVAAAKYDGQMRLARRADQLRYGAGLPPPNNPPPLGGPKPGANPSPPVPNTGPTFGASQPPGPLGRSLVPSRRPVAPGQGLALQPPEPPPAQPPTLAGTGIHWDVGNTGDMTGSFEVGGRSFAVEAVRTNIGGSGRAYSNTYHIVFDHGADASPHARGQIAHLTSRSVMHLIDNHNPAKVEFSADANDPAQVKFCDRMAKDLAKASGYLRTSKVDEDEHHFALRRPSELYFLPERRDGTQYARDGSPHRYALTPPANNPPQVPQPEPGIRKAVPKLPTGDVVRQVQQQRQQPKAAKTGEQDAWERWAQGQTGDRGPLTPHDPRDGSPVPGTAGDEGEEETTGRRTPHPSMQANQVIHHLAREHPAMLSDYIQERNVGPLTQGTIAAAKKALETLPAGHAAYALHALEEQSEIADRQKEIPVKNLEQFNAAVFGQNQFQGRITSPEYSYDKMQSIPSEGEDIYFRGPDGNVMAVGVVREGGVRDTGTGVKLDMDIRKVESGDRLHSPEAEGAYKAGFQHGDVKPPPGMEGMNAQQAREHADVLADNLPAQTGADDAHHHADWLEAQEALASHDHRHHRIGRRDAERMLPHGHSVEGMRSQDPADDQDRWAVKHAEAMRKPLEEMLAVRGVPPGLLTVGHGSGGPQRPNRVAPGGAGGAAIPGLPFPVTHTLLDEAYPLWQQHLEEGGGHGKDEFHKVMGDVIDKAFPPDQHPYDALVGLLERTGNPHDMDQDDYWLQQLKWQADRVKTMPAAKLAEAPPEVFQLAAALANKSTPHVYREADKVDEVDRVRRWVSQTLPMVPNGGDNVDAMQWYPGLDRTLYPAREILRRVKAFDELPEDVQYGVERSLDPNSHSGVSDLHDMVRGGIVPQELINRVNNETYTKSFLSAKGVTPASAFQKAIRDMGRVAAAFHQQQQPTKLRHDDTPDRYGLGDLTSDQYARQGLGSFTNPGGFAPGGSGTDYPSNFKQQGPVKPPQPWQLQGRQPPKPMAAAGGGAAQPQRPQPRPQPSARSYGPPDEEEQDFQDRPEHDPTEPPDAYAGERIPPQMKGTGLTPKDVQALRDELGKEGFEAMLKALDEEGGEE